MHIRVVLVMDVALSSEPFATGDLGVVLAIEEVSIKSLDLTAAITELAAFRQREALFDAELTSQTIDADRQRERVAEIEASTSWRMTAPFRAFADDVKSFLRWMRRAG